MVLVGENWIQAGGFYDEMKELIEMIDEPITKVMTDPNFEAYTVVDAMKIIEGKKSWFIVSHNLFSARALNRGGVRRERTRLF